MEQSQELPIHTPSKRNALCWFLFLAVLVITAVGVLVLPRIFAELRYPLAYEDLLVKEAVDHDLDPFLVAAVIYSESRYRPDATSPVGARGLMQIMPQTGQGIANRMGESSFTVDKLYDPATNLRYGTFHLQGLIGRYDSNVEAALVAYNGGGGAGDRFVDGNHDLVSNESLNYYQKVLNAKSRYEELYPARLSSQRALDEFFQPPGSEPLVNVLLRAIQNAVASRINQ